MYQRRSTWGDGCAPWSRDPLAFAAALLCLSEIADVGVDEANQAPLEWSVVQELMPALAAA